MPTVTFPAASPQAPTPTPIVHIVQSGDTFSGIALRYGVSVEALQKANPQLNPQALPVGAQVLVPQAGQALGLLATPTPHPARLRGPWCFATAEGSVCTLAVVNPSQAPLVGVRVVLEVLDPTWPEGEVWRTVTQPWLMFVPPEDELPLAVALPRALSPRAAVRAALVAALPAGSTPLPVVRIDEVRLSVVRQGPWLLTRARLWMEKQPMVAQLQRVGVLVAAYDAQKRVVALRYTEGKAAAWFAAAQEVPLYPLVPANQVTDLRAWAEGYR